MQANGAQGLAGWRWIFILEGAVCYLGKQMLTPTTRAMAHTPSSDYLCDWTPMLQADRRFPRRGTSLMAIPR